jgi:hypothetical protein
MDFIDLLRSALAGGRLEEPFSAADATRAVARTDWPLARVQSYLVRYCQGNLAAGIVLFERAAFGRYRLLTDGPRRLHAATGRRRSGPTRELNRTAPHPPGDPK